MRTKCKQCKKGTLVAVSTFDRVVTTTDQSVEHRRSWAYFDAVGDVEEQDDEELDADTETLEREQDDGEKCTHVSCDKCGWIDAEHPLTTADSKEVAALVTQWKAPTRNRRGPRVRTATHLPDGWTLMQIKSLGCQSLESGSNFIVEFVGGYRFVVNLDEDPVTAFPAMRGFFVALLALDEAGLSQYEMGHNIARCMATYDNAPSMFIEVHVVRGVVAFEHVRPAPGGSTLRYIYDLNLAA